MDESVYFRLLVIALCSVSECSQRRYHHININMNWTEAQRYCRENYTDLATVNNMNDMNELMSKVKNNGVNDNDLHVWIGLKNTSVYKWKWSMGHTVDYKNWENKQSDNTNDCTIMKNSGKWDHKDCNDHLNFICYNEISKDYIYEETQKTTWTEAQSFCRQHHTDLTSVRNQTENDEIQTKIKNNGNEVWIGLFSDSWQWSDNSNSTFRKWKSDEPNGDNSEPCTEVYVNELGQWNNIGCSVSQTFVCHEDNLILIKEKMSWPEALVYCRQHHVDLVSVVSEKIQRWLKEVIVNASTASVWMGLRHSCSVGIWFWVNGEPVCYQKWAPGNGTSVEDCDPVVRSGAVQREGDHQWISRPDTDKLNFICITRDSE
ncbi:C-type mannose receptor 2-like [Paramisgurnus dabryanus]|uniref:C-type mannose receptor 2-like n=1 Tax=Paramisgurnus dabryanus TaxID=90735 RepID=UPI0031F3CB7B